MTYNLYLIEKGLKTLIITLKNKRKVLELVAVLDFDEVEISCEKLLR